jgi:hypothetical protein
LLCPRTITKRITFVLHRIIEINQTSQVLAWFCYQWTA